MSTPLRIVENGKKLNAFASLHKIAIAAQMIPAQ
jgi:hypothetical protein